LFPESSDDLSLEKAREAVGQYAKFRQSIEATVPEVEKEQSKWEKFISDVESQRQAELARKNEELEAAYQAFLARQYEPTSEYTEATLLSIAEQGKNLMEQLPDKAAEIETFLKPWIQHALYLDQGRVYLEGEWLTPEEIRDRKIEKLNEAMEAFLREGISLQMESVVVPQTSVLLALGVSILTLVLILYIFLWLASSRGGNLTFGGAIFLIFGLAVLGAYGYFGFKLFSGPTTIKEALPLAGDQQGDSEVLKRALFLASKPKDYQLGKDDLSIEIPDSQLNPFLDNHLEFVRVGESDLFDMERLRFACLFFNDHVMLFDEVVVFGKSFLIRHRLNHVIDSENISFTGFQVYLGEARLPGQLAGHFWMNLREDLAKLLKISRIPEIYQISDIEEGVIKLTLTRTPEKAEPAEIQ
jgi:hypothetical protein